MFIVFDLDGTLSDPTHRLHFIQDGRRDYASFFAACGDDAPNMHVIRTLQAHVCDGHRVEIWSARSDVVRAETEAWLERYGIDAARLVHMRAAGDHTPDETLKRFWLLQLHPDERPDVIYDDRQRVVDMWRREGVACFQVTANWEAPSERRIAPIVEPLLTLLVGPSCAGKTTHAKGYPADWVLSTDALRGHYCGGDFRDQSRNADVFTALRRLAAARLSCGLPVVIDATNLRRKDRVALVSLAPETSRVRYVVLDRPLAAKQAAAGWRADVVVDGKSLIESHAEVFASNLKHILAGDGVANVEVSDERETRAAA